MSSTKGYKNPDRAEEDFKQRETYAKYLTTYKERHNEIYGQGDDENLNARRSQYQSLYAKGDTYKEKSGIKESGSQTITKSAAQYEEEAKASEDYDTKATSVSTSLANDMQIFNGWINDAIRYDEDDNFLEKAYKIITSPIEAYEAGKTALETYAGMTDDQKKTYNYLLNLHSDNWGEETPEADAYLEAIKEEAVQNTASKISDFATNMADDGNYGVAIGYGAVAGTNQYVQGVANTYKSIDGLIFDEDKDYYDTDALTYASNNIRNYLGEDADAPTIFGNTYGQFAYDTVTSIANMMPSIIVGAASGGTSTLSQVASGVTMASGVFGSAYQQKRSEGQDKGRSALYAGVNSALEVGLQYFFGGIKALSGNKSLANSVKNKIVSKVMSKIDSESAKLVADYGADFVARCMGEFGDEFTQEILEPIYSSLIFKEDSESYGEAFLEGIDQIDWGQAVYNGLIGFFTSAMFNSVAGGEDGEATPLQAYVDYRNTSNYGKAINNLAYDQVNNIVSEGLTMPQDTKAYEYASGIVNKVNTPKGASNYEMGRYAQELVNQRNSDTQAKIEEVNKKIDTINAPEETIETAKDFADKIVEQDVNVSYDLINSLPTTSEVKEALKETFSDELTNDTDTIDVKKISNIDKDGNVKVTLADGTEVDATEDNLSSNDYALVNLVSSLGYDLETSNSILGGMKINNHTASRFMDVVNEVNMGKLNVSNDVASDSTMLSTQKAYYREIGRKLASQEKSKRTSKNVKLNDGGIVFETTTKYDIDNLDSLDERRKSSIKMAEALTDVIGGTIHIYESKVVEHTREDGSKYNTYELEEDLKVGNKVYEKGTAAQNALIDTNTGDIYLDMNAGSYGEGVMMYALSHEYTHLIRMNSPEMFEKLATFVINEMYKQGEDVDALIRERQAREQEAQPEEDITYDYAREEFIADSLETMLTSKDMATHLENLYNTDKSLWDKFVDLLKKFKDAFSKVYEQYKGLDTGNRTRSGEIVANFNEETYKQLSEMYAEALKIATSHETIKGDLAEASREMEIGKVKTNEKGEALAISNEDDSVVLNSIRTWNDGGREATKELLALRRDRNGNRTYSDEDIEFTLAFIDRKVKFLENLAKDNDKLNKSIDMAVDIDLRSGKATLHTLVSNGDYPVNFDLSTICKKREAYQGVLNHLLETKLFDQVKFDSEAVAEVNAILREYGFETACPACFVEAKRTYIQDWANKFVDLWNTEVDKVKKNASYFNFYDNTMNGIETLSDDDVTSLAETYSKSALNDKGNINVGKGSTSEKMARLIKKNPGVYARKFTVYDIVSPKALLKMRTADATMYSLLLSTYGQATPKVTQEFSPYASDGARLTFKYVEQSTGKTIAGKGDYIKNAAEELGYESKDYSIGRKVTEATADKTNEKVIKYFQVQNLAMRNYLYDIGGARNQSFSDFIIEDVFDKMQLLSDLAIQGFPMHEYTKEISDARIFGMTGAKVNGSIIHKIDKTLGKEFAGLTRGKDGELTYVAGDFSQFDRSNPKESFTQSIGWKDAVALMLDKRYSSNFGTIAIGFSDKHIEMMLDDALIRQIIPYHKSGIPTVFAELTSMNLANDYTDYQETKIKDYFTLDGKPSDKIEGKADTHFSFNKSMRELGDARKAAQAYVDWCAEQHPIYDGKKIVGYCTFTPKFEKFTSHNNYYKLLEDFNVYDCITEEYAPQGDVTMTYPSVDDLTEQDIKEYRARLENTSIFTKQEIDKYVKKAQRDVDQIISDELESRKAFRKAQEPLVKECYEKIDETLKQRPILNSSRIQGLEDYSTDEIKGIAKDYINDKISSEGISAKIVDLAIHGSRGRGTARVDSDLDIVFQYKGSIREDDFFSALNEEPLYIDDIQVDINPIKENLASYMARSNEYDAKFSTRESRYKAYDQAVKDGNEELAQQLVDEEASSRGYTKKVYHGTDTFGFTIFNPEFSDDNLSLFTSDNERLAKTYTEFGEKRPIGKKVKKIDVKNAPIKEVYEYAKSEGMTEWEMHTSKESVDKATCSYANATYKKMTKSFESYQKIRFGKTNISDILRSFENGVTKSKLIKLYDEFTSLRSYRELYDDLGNSIMRDLPKLVDAATIVKYGSNAIFTFRDSVLLESSDFRNIVLEETKNSTESGIYQLYINPTDFMEVDAKGHLWSSIPWSENITPKSYDVSEEITKMHFIVDTWESYFWRDMTYSDFVNDVLHNGLYDSMMQGINEDEDVQELLKDSNIKKSLEYAKEIDEVYNNWNEEDSLEDALMGIDYENDVLPYKTRDLSRIAYEKGYKGLHIKNVEDNGYAGYSDNGDLYIFYESNQVKSADPITYDDDGNAIPLSERFTPEKTDIRFSSRDKEYNDALQKGDMDKANTLVQEAAKKNGYNSPKLYHGTNQFGFTVFDRNKNDRRRLGFFTSNSKDVAATYTLANDSRSIKETNEAPTSEEALKTIKDNADELTRKLWNWSSEWWLDYNDIYHIFEGVQQEFEGGMSFDLFDQTLYENLEEEVVRLFGNLQEDGEYDGMEFAEWEETDEGDDIMSAVSDFSTLATTNAKYILYGDADIKAGIYSLYGNIDNFMEVDAKGKNWNNIDFSYKNKNYRDLSYKNKDVTTIRKLASKLDNMYDEGSLSESEYVDLITNDNGKIDLSLVKNVAPEYKEFFKSIDRYMTLYNNLIADGKGYDASDVVWAIDNLGFLKDTTNDAIAETKEAQKGEYINGTYNTESLARIADEQGFNGVHIVDVYDNSTYGNAGIGDVYIFFNAKDLKSADVITYDNEGQVVPLEERFANTNDDIRYSTRDSQGNELSKGQIEFFENSKVRDENGNLLRLYHSTNKEFTKFEKTSDYLNHFIYLSTSKNWSRNYVKETTYADNPRTIEAYVNITNPLDMSKYGYTHTYQEWVDILEKNDVELSQGFKDMYQNKSGEMPFWYLIKYDFSNAESEYYTGLKDSLENAGYDGIHILDTYRGKGRWVEQGDTYVAFSSNQVKSIDNKTPTSNEDIHYSQRGVMSNERLNFEIKDSSAGIRKDYAQNWIATISPSDFIELTTSERYRGDREKFDNQLVTSYGKTMDSWDFLEETKKNRQTPYLIIDYENGEVIGHEGRHRMRALEQNGIDQAEILVMFYDGDGYKDKSHNLANGRLESISEIKVNGQFDDKVSGIISNIVPLNEDHREEIFEKHGENAIGSYEYEGEFLYSNRFSDSIVTDKKTLDFLSNQETMKVYRAMALIDGNLYPPMASKLPSENGGKVLAPSSIIGKWEQAIERPELITFEDGKPKFYLIKDNNKKVPARYNPYIHTSLTPLNDQFAEAYQRPNMVVVEGEIPISELTSGYKAEYAKDSVGITKWKSGKVASKLAKFGKPREVILSRWFKPTRIVPDSEVANTISSIIEGTNIAIPRNVVTPSLYEELNKANVSTIDNLSIDEKGNIVVDKNVKFSTRETDVPDNRTILANTLMSATQNDVEKGIIEKYQNKIDQYNAMEKELSEVKVELKELSFAKGKRDTKRIAELRDKQIKLTNNLNTADSQLLKIEASSPLKKLLDREKLQIKKSAENKGKQIVKQRWEDKNEALAKRQQKEKLQKLVLDTSRWLTNPKKEETPCPDVLLEPMRNFIDSIDLSSKRLASGGKATKNDMRIDDAMNKLAKKIRAIQNGQSRNNEAESTGEEVVDIPNGFLDLPLTYASDLEKISDSILARMMPTAKAYANDITSQITNETMKLDDTNTIVNNMSSEEIKDLVKAIKTLRKAINDMQKLYANSRFARVDDLARDTIAYAESLSKNKYNNGVKNFLNWENTLPYYAFKRVGKGGESLFEEFEDALDREAFLSKQILDYKDENWSSKDAGNWAKEMHEYKTEEGKDIKISTTQIMSMYCLNKRSQAQGHIYAGGFRIVGQKTRKGTSSSIDANLSVKDVNSLIGKLTPEQVKVADAIQNFMSKKSARWINEISQKRFLTDMATEEFYFPIESVRDEMVETDPDVRGNDMFRLLNLSALKPITPNANNRIVLKDIFDIFATHTSDTAKLNAYGMALLDYMKWTNYREGDVSSLKGVRKSLNQTFGDDTATKYFRKLIKDINGVQNVSEHPWAKKMIRNYKVAAVASNIRVALLQPTSYIRAEAVLTPQALAYGLRQKPQVEKAQKYCGIAQWKAFGFYDTDISRNVTDLIKDNGDWKEKAIEVSLLGAEWGDKITWGALWNACEYEVMKTHEYEIGTEEFNIAVGKKLREVVYRTQVVDSVLTRSQNMREKSLEYQMFTAFMSEPTLSYNLLLDGYTTFNQDAQRVGAKESWTMNKRYITKGAFAYITTATVAALVESLVDVFRNSGYDDDDEDKTFKEKYLDEFFGNLANDINPLNKVAFLKDVVSIADDFLGLGYFSSDRMDIDYLNNLYDALKILQNWSEKGKEESYYTDYAFISKFAKSISQFSGLPISNAIRDVVIVWNETAGRADESLKIEKYNK